MTLTECQSLARKLALAAPSWAPIKAQLQLETLADELKRHAQPKPDAIESEETLP